jgi:hypothetical protein
MTRDHAHNPDPSPGDYDRLVKMVEEEAKLGGRLTSYLPPFPKKPKPEGTATSSPASYFWPPSPVRRDLTHMLALLDGHGLWR